jgi:hypothetical protein
MESGVTKAVVGTARLCKVNLGAMAHVDGLGHTLHVGRLCWLATHRLAPGPLSTPAPVVSSALGPEGEAAGLGFRPT